MVPDSAQTSPVPQTTKTQDAMVLAGYRECATEAMRWLSGLGYEPGHPLIRSLAAHLTKKQGYLEKINLESFLVDQSTHNTHSKMDNKTENVPCPTFTEQLQQLQNDADVQRALVEIVFRGCDLQYHSQFYEEGEPI